MFFKIISQLVLVKLQTDIVFAQSLRNFYDELLISIFFRNTPQCPEAPLHVCSAKGCSEGFRKNQRKTLMPNSLI